MVFIRSLITALVLAINIQPANAYLCTDNPANCVDIQGMQRLQLGVAARNNSIACSSTEKALLRYNSSTDYLEYCNGTSWVASGGAVNLGTTASVTNPQRSGDATTGLFSPAASTVAIATGGTEQVRVDSSGNMGVGGTAASTLSLDVGSRTNAMRPPKGTTAQQPTCSGTIAGAMRYNTTTTYMEYCNGTVWQTMNAASPGTIAPGCGTSGTLSSTQQTTLAIGAGCTVVFKVWGAGGGSGFAAVGGGGGYSTITLGPLGSSTTYYLVVGGKGVYGSTTNSGGLTGYLGGAAGAVANGSDGAGSGGAASGVWTGNYGTTAVVISAGGGGASKSVNGGDGGAGGAQTGTGTGANGGAGGYTGGGGGGGYTGGTASNDGGHTSYGGSNYAASGGTTSAGSGGAPANSGDSNRPGNCGYTNYSYGANGYDGCIYYTTY